MRGQDKTHNENDSRVNRGWQAGENQHASSLTIQASVAGTEPSSGEVNGTYREAVVTAHAIERDTYTPHLRGRTMSEELNTTVATEATTEATTDGKGSGKGGKGSGKGGKGSRTRKPKPVFAVPEGRFQNATDAQTGYDVSSHAKLKSLDFADPLEFAIWEAWYYSQKFQAAQKRVEDIRKLGDTAEERKANAELAKLAEALRAATAKIKGKSSPLADMLKAALGDSLATLM